MDIFIPALISAIPSVILGIAAWWFKRSIDKRDKLKEAREKEKEEKRELREKNTEQLMMLIMQNTRATHILAEATAKAVQRIPDAHCNGDMTSALALASQIQQEEKNFIMDQGIKHIFEP